jgi:hypothetical protein
VSSPFGTQYRRGRYHHHVPLPPSRRATDVTTLASYLTIPSLLASSRSCRCDRPCTLDCAAEHSFNDAMAMSNIPSYYLDRRVAHFAALAAAPYLQMQSLMAPSQRYRRLCSWSPPGVADGFILGRSMVLTTAMFLITSQHCRWLSPCPTHHRRISPWSPRDAAVTTHTCPPVSAASLDARKRCTGGCLRLGHTGCVSLG